MFAHNSLGYPLMHFVFHRASHTLSWALSIAGPVHQVAVKRSSDESGILTVLAAVGEVSKWVCRNKYCYTTARASSGP